MDALSIGSAISGLKTAGDIAGSFLKIRDIALVQGKVIELQSVILSAQQSALAAQGEQFALLEDKRKLEKQIADLEAWDAEKKRYELTELAPGVMAYSLKPEAANGEPPHKICGACYQRGRKGFLAREAHTITHRVIEKCGLCKTEIVTATGAF